MKAAFRGLGAAALLCGVLVAAAASGQTRYVAFGDSITEGFGDEEERGGYPGRLQALLTDAGDDAQVSNFGSSGETTVEGLARINSVLGLGGDVLLLMEGTNDIGAGLSIETARFNLDQMVQRATARGFAVVQGTVIPRLRDSKQDAGSVGTGLLNQRIRHSAGVGLRDLVDPWEIFIVQDDFYDRFYLDDPGDLVGHPNAAGYDLIAEAFFNVLTGIDAVSPVLGLSIPENGDGGVNPRVNVQLDVWDFGTGTNLSATTLLINGAEVAAQVQRVGERITVSYQPPSAFQNAVRVGLRSEDQATPPNAVDRDLFSFIVRGAGFVAGDVNFDGRVDAEDLFRLARAFGAETGSARYDASVDLDGDGVVDGSDLAVLASNFGS